MLQLASVKKTGRGNSRPITKTIHFYKSIKKAEPGSIITFNLTNNKLIFYKKNNLIQNDFKNYSAEEIDHEIKGSVERHLRSDRKIAIFISVFQPMNCNYNSWTEILK